MNSLLELFCDVDDFCQSFVPGWQTQLLLAGEIQRQRNRSLSISEIITCHFHQSHYRDFKAYYTEYVLERLRNEFPNLVSYTRFVEFISSVLLPVCSYLRRNCFGTCTGISFMDATAIAVCKNPENPLSQGVRRTGRTRKNLIIFICIKRGNAGITFPTDLGLYRSEIEIAGSL